MNSTHTVASVRTNKERPCIVHMSRFVCVDFLPSGSFWFNSVHHVFKINFQNPSQWNIFLALLRQRLKDFNHLWSNDKQLKNVWIISCILLILASFNVTFFMFETGSTGRPSAVTYKQEKVTACLRPTLGVPGNSRNTQRGFEDIAAILPLFSCREDTEEPTWHLSSCRKGIISKKA